MAITPAEIAETRGMVEEQNLDIRTITMGVSLMGCGDENLDRMCTKIYDHVTHTAEHLVETAENLEREYGIPIVNKRVSVTPVAQIAACCKDEDLTPIAHALDRAAETLGIDYLAASPHSSRRASATPTAASSSPSPGARHHEPRLLQRQRRQPARWHQHGRRADGRADHHRRRQAHGRPGFRRRFQVCLLCQHGRGLPVYGGRRPWRWRGRRRHQRWCLGPRRYGCCLGDAPRLRLDDGGCRKD